MSLSETGLRDAIKHAYTHGGGYTLAGDARTAIIYAKDFFVRAEWKAIPNKALATITEHIGLIYPEELPLKIVKAADPQTVLQSTVAGISSSWMDMDKALPGMETIATLGGYKLYQQEDFQIYGADTDLLQILDDPEEVEPYITPKAKSETARAVWSLETATVGIMAFRPEDGREDKLKKMWTALEAINVTRG